MAKIETVKIKGKGKDEIIIINKKDFDSKKHKLHLEEAPKAPVDPPKDPVVPPVAPPVVK